jgi:hypothetical protein
MPSKSKALSSNLSTVKNNKTDLNLLDSETASDGFYHIKQQQKMNSLRHAIDI